MLNWSEPLDTWAPNLTLGNAFDKSGNDILPEPNPPKPENLGKFKLRPLDIPFKAENGFPILILGKLILGNFGSFIFGNFGKLIFGNFIPGIGIEDIRDAAALANPPKIPFKALKSGVAIVGILSEIPLPSASAPDFAVS